MGKCNEVISKIVLNDDNDDGEDVHEGSNISCRF